MAKDPIHARFVLLHTSMARAPRGHIKFIRLRFTNRLALLDQVQRLRFCSANRIFITVASFMSGRLRQQVVAYLPTIFFFSIIPCSTLSGFHHMIM